MEKTHPAIRMPPRIVKAASHNRTSISKRHIRSPPSTPEYAHQPRTKHEARHIALSPANQIPVMYADLACGTASWTYPAHAWTVPATNQQLPPFLDQPQAYHGQGYPVDVEVQLTCHDASVPRASWNHGSSEDPSRSQWQFKNSDSAHIGAYRNFSQHITRT